MKVKNDLNSKYWNSRYQEHKTGWDLGEVSPPLKDYIDQLTDRSQKILVPGGGNSYEAEYLFKKGFENVFVVDIAWEPLQNFKKRMSDFPEENLIYNDFFELKGNFDLVIEQTFFCALPVLKRMDYAVHTNRLLKEGGKVVGVLFNTYFSCEGPPFGGSKEEYLTYFKPYFEIRILEPCYNSIQPREGNELFFIFEKN